ncbi:MAG: hypothetical protein RL243_1020, partial [Actinomycetota bacterium]
MPFRVEAVAVFSNPTAAPLDAGDISLRALSELWFDEVFAMVNDPHSAALTGTKKKFSEAEIRSWLATRRSQLDRCDWAILDNESGEFAGEVVLNEYNPERNSMNVRIALAGTRWFDRGIGTAALDAVLTFAFDSMQLAKVTLSVLVDNPRAIRVYQKLGFQTGRQYADAGLRYQR